MRDEFGKVEYRYFNRAGLLDSLKTRKGELVVHTYDPTGQLMRTAFPQDTIVRTYDPVGRLLTGQNRQGTVTREYSREGTIRWERQVTGAEATVWDVTMRYQYDSGSRRTQFSNGSDTVFYGYGPDGRLAQLKIKWAQATTFPPDSFLFRWDSLGRRDYIRYPNGTDVFFGYDADGHLRTVCSKHAGGPTTDHLDQRLFVKALSADGFATELFRYVGVVEGSGCGSAGNGTLIEGFLNTIYDGRHQLLSTSSQTFRYDASGNLVFKDVAATTDSFSITPGSNRIATLFHEGWNPVTVTYDANGNRTSDGWRSMAYNALGQMSTANDKYCFYDALGRSTGPCGGGARLVYDGDNVVGAQNSSGSWSFIHGPGLDDPLMSVFCSFGSCQKYYYVTDGQGRQLAFTGPAGEDRTSDLIYTREGGNQAGAIERARTFDNSRGETVNAPKLSYYRNRYYDQQTGRWLQEDPAGIAGGVNLYAYVGNNPVTYTDPFGLCPICVAAFALFEIGSTVYDVGDLAVTGVKYLSGRASGLELSVTAAGTVAGLWSVGGGLGAAGRAGLRSFTKRNFRENLGRATGGVVEGAHAHHILPQEFADRFAKAGISVNDPQFGAWWEASSHLRNAAQYNAEWERFLGRERTADEIMEFGRQIAERYGIEARF